MGLGELVALLLPFVLLVGFWALLMQRQRRMPNPTVDKLEEIRQELEGIRRAVERDPFGKR